MSSTCQDPPYNDSLVKSMRVVRSSPSARHVSLKVSKSHLEWQRAPLQALDNTFSTSPRKNGRESVAIDDLKEKGNTEATDSEEETDDEDSKKVLLKAPLSLSSQQQRNMYKLI